MKYLLLIVMALFFDSESSFSQSNIFSADTYVSFSPLALIDYKDGLSIRLSADKRIHKQLSLSAEYIFYTSLANFFAYKTDPRGYSIKPCIKLYINHGDSSRAAYIALEYQYKHQTYTLNDTVFYSGGSPLNTKYTMSRYVNCISVKAGVLEKVTNRIVFEYFVGIGIRFFRSNPSLSPAEYGSIIQNEDHHNSEGGAG